MAGEREIVQKKQLLCRQADKQRGKKGAKDGEKQVVCGESSVRVTFRLIFWRTNENISNCS